MGADIWLGKRDASMGYFRDDYVGVVTLNYLGISYWGSLSPLLKSDGAFPLERNAWLIGELRQRAAERLTGPDATDKMRAYLAKYELRGVPDMLVDVLYNHVRQLIDLLERSTALGVPLYMSL